MRSFHQYAPVSGGMSGQIFKELQKSKEKYNNSILSPPIPSSLLIDNRSLKKPCLLD